MRRASPDAGTLAAFLSRRLVMLAVMMAARMRLHFSPFLGLRLIFFLGADGGLFHSSDVAAGDFPRQRACCLRLRFGICGSRRFHRLSTRTRAYHERGCGDGG